MYVCPALNVVYLAQPRTASRSVTGVLRLLGPVEQVAGHHSVQHDRLSDLREEGYRVLAAVRNHWDIIVSWYHWQHGPGQAGAKRSEPFDSFVLRFPSMTENGYIKPDALFWQYAPFATDLLRYETLWRDLQAIVGQTLPEQQRIGASVRRPYRDYYSDRTRQYVADQYAAEIALYGYSFEPYHAPAEEEV